MICVLFAIPQAFLLKNILFNTEGSNWKDISGLLFIILKRIPPCFHFWVLSITLKLGSLQHLKPLFRIE